VVWGDPEVGGNKALRNVGILSKSHFTLNMEAIKCSEISVSYHITTLYPEDGDNKALRNDGILLHH